jgi:hypothetical protein
MGYPGRERPALDDINLTIRPGEHILLTGPSGAGKSSLLALLLGFVPPGSGTIVAGDTDLAQIPADRWLPQSPGCRSTRTCCHDGPANSAGASPRRGRRSRRPRGWLGPMTSSGGCPRATTPSGEGGRPVGRAAAEDRLARAFLRRAPLLLLDEPTALDRPARFWLTAIGPSGGPHRGHRRAPAAPNRPPLPDPTARAEWHRTAGRTTDHQAGWRARPPGRCGAIRCCGCSNRAAVSRLLLAVVARPPPRVRDRAAGGIRFPAGPRVPASQRPALGGGGRGAGAELAAGFPAISSAWPGTMPRSAS